MSEQREQPKNNVHPRAYHGHPNNQRNRDAPNAWNGKPNPDRSQRQARPSTKTAPPTLPPPTKLHDTSHVKITEVSPADSSLFGLGVRTREAKPLESFSPMNPSIIDISRNIYREITTDILGLQNTILPEYLDYYSAAMYWLRIITLKAHNSQETTPAEAEILKLVKETPFCLPEPLYLQIRQTGNVVTPLKQHLLTKFPPLPTHVLNGHGGYFGQLLIPGQNINNGLHNLYEELPCLGVLAAAVRATVSDLPPGPYPSVV